MVPPVVMTVMRRTATLGGSLFESDEVVLHRDRSVAGGAGSDRAADQRSVGEAEEMAKDHESVGQRADSTVVVHVEHGLQGHQARLDRGSGAVPALAADRSVDECRAGETEGGAQEEDSVG